jgi:hypothetical protein
MENLRTTRPKKKLDYKRTGPYKIIQKIGELAYKLCLPQTMSSIHPVFHISLLTRYKPDTVEHRERGPSPAPPDLIEGEEYYDMEKILDAKIMGRGFGRKMHYLVKWLGHPAENNTWVPRTNLEEAEETRHRLEEFEREHPGLFVNDPAKVKTTSIAHLTYEQYYTIPWQEL